MSYFRARSTVVHQLPIGQVFEADLAQAHSKGKAKGMGQATELDSSLTAAPVLSGSPLLADSYPGDVGIGSDPSVVWSEDFSEASIAALVARYSDIANQPGMAFDVDVPTNNTSGKSLKMTSSGSGANSTYLYKNLAGIGTGAEWWVRYYVKYQAGVQFHHAGAWFGGYNPPINFPFPHAGQKPNGDDWFHMAIEQLDGGPIDQLDTYASWMNMHGASGSFFGNTVIHDTAFLRNAGWTCIEIHHKLNTDPLSSAGGQLEVYKDGVLVKSFTPAGPNGYWVFDKFCPLGTTDTQCTPYDPGIPTPGYAPLNLQFRSTLALTLNYLWLQNYIDTAGVTGDLKLSNIVVATRRVGPIAPVSAPTTFNFYIASAGGDDSGPGTLAQPWTINAINTRQTTYAGKKVGLLNGTYNIVSLIANVPSFDRSYYGILKFTGGPDAAHPTVIAAVNPRQAIITTTPIPSAQTDKDPPLMSNYAQSSREFATIDGIVFDTYAEKAIYCGIYSSNTNGYNGFRGIVIQNCEFKNQNGTGGTAAGNFSCIEFAGCDGALVRNNYFHDNIGYGPNSSDHFNACLEWWCTQTVYEYNTIVRSGCGFFGKSVGGSGAVMRYNYVDATSFSSGPPDPAGAFGWSSPNAKPPGQSLPPIGIQPVQIHHNIFLAGSTAAIMLKSEYLSDEQLWGYDVYNNVLRGGSPFHDTATFTAKTRAGQGRAYNNIISQRVSGGAQIGINSNFAGICDYNYYDNRVASAANIYPTENSASPDGSSPYSTISAWHTAMGNQSDGAKPEAHGGIMAGGDPRFDTSQAAAADKYKLSTGGAIGVSPCINVGRSNGTPAGSVVDMGAWGNSPPSRIGCSFAQVNP